MSIRFKVVFAITLAVAITIASITAMVSYKMKESFVASFAINSQAQIERLNAFVETYFENALAQVQILANAKDVTANIEYLTSYVNSSEVIIPDVAQFTPQERSVVETIQTILDAHPNYEMGYVGSQSGGFTQSPNNEDTAQPIGYDPRQRPWYADVQSTKKAAVTEAYLSDAGNAIVCTVAAPIMTPSFAGVAGFDLSIATLTNEIGGISIGKTGFIIMLDNTNQVVSVPMSSGDKKWEESSWLGQNITDLPADVQKALQQLINQRSGVATVEYNDTKYLARVGINTFGWPLIMIQQQQEIFQDAFTVMTSIFLVGLGVFVIMCAMAWFVSRSIVKPVSMLGIAAQAVAGGDLDAIPADESLFKAEVGSLHKSLLFMVSKLRELIDTANAKMRDAEEALETSRNALAEAERAKSLAEVARKDGLNQAADEVEVVVDEVSLAVERLSSQSTNIEHMTQEQTSLIYSTSTAIGEMSATVSEVAASASRTADLAAQASSDSARGKALVEQVTESMEQIESQTISMRDSLQSLGNQVDDIGSIIGMINDVADQTNLLALNAAIEAARAGEAGRGFAVVADEVRKLAEKTMEATRQVETSINGIQAGTRHSVTSMQEAADFVVSSMQTVKEADDALSRIEDRVNTTANEINMIATASEEQSATTVEMRNSAETLNNLAGSIASGMDKTLSDVEVLDNLMKQLHEVMSSLRKG